jgi:hypothetical protein
LTGTTVRPSLSVTLKSAVVDGTRAGRPACRRDSDCFDL